MQKNLCRTEFEPFVECTNPVDDDRQEVDFTGYFRIGDVVDVVDVDANGKVTSVIADNLTIEAIDPDVAVVLSSSVDTSSAVGTPKIRCQSIDDGQEAIDRLYRTPQVVDPKLIIKESILAQELNQPSAGKTLYRVANTKFIKAGDKFDILADEGLVASDVVIDSVSNQADDSNNKAYVAITSLVDTSAFTNPFLLSKDITLQEAIERNQEKIDGIDSPVENEYVGVGDKSFTCFELVNLFVQGSSKIDLDGSRMRLGTPGTRAYYEHGTYPGNNDSLKFTSMIMGLDGNKTSVEILSGAGLAVTVTGNFITGYKISINDNSGAATAQDIADAINADADAKRIVQVQYGGDGTGTVSTLAETDLAGGLDDGTGDYAELEQIYRNNIANTGYKWVSFHIRPLEQNRMNKPPQEDEEIIADYRKATENIDY